ncbi:mce related protein [Nocardioides dokdonensis FR1436]|uniref:Mce related protein n=1 Tax=Nocardioides dokdonensis FR1436 TaxID=1300347 RepID=A0A1A9GR12_9ACTN|nr:MCE family protein [Nocardioides dokdonensis]ANH39911.1 mce related protein [Nocardioides dokdonensis FR1436]
MDRLLARGPAVVVVLLLLAGSFLALRGGDETKQVTAHFPRAVSVYVGTDVRILGVNVGEVTAVVPDGEAVRVEMEYDGDVDVPDDAQAVVVTPTLVADRFVQLTPAYTEGEVMADGAEIELPDTGVPVELDRIYASLRDLSTALGPDGANADGTLDNLLRASSEALEGQGEAGNDMINELSRAAETFGEGSGDLFETVSALAVFTDTLARNDRLVRAFVRDLAGVSADLEEEREELGAALTSVSSAVGTVEKFVRENRTALVGDVEKLTRTVKTIASERESIDQALTSAPVSIGNLALAFNNETGSIGSRIGVSGNVWDADGFLCSVVQQSALPRVSKNLACTLFEAILEPITSPVPTLPPEQRAQDPAARRQGGPDRSRPDQARYVSDPGASLADLLGGRR